MTTTANLSLSLERPKRIADMTAQEIHDYRNTPGNVLYRGTITYAIGERTDIEDTQADYVLQAINLILSNKSVAAIVYSVRVDHHTIGGLRGILLRAEHVKAAAV